MKASEHWSIKALAQRVGVATHVLRHWEDVGLLDPPRDANGYRRYCRADLTRALVIRRSQAAGMSLPQIRVLLQTDAGERGEALRQHLDRLDRLAHEIERSRAMVQHALECRSHDIATCPQFAAYVSDVADGLVPEGSLEGVPEGHRPYPPGDE